MRILACLLALGALISTDVASAQEEKEVNLPPEVAEFSCDNCLDACDAPYTGCDARACDRWYLFPQDYCGISVHGWVDGGFIWNTSKPDSKFNGPYNGVDRANEGMLNQLYLVTEMALPECGMGVGGRFDVLYGQDSFLAQSIGMEKRPDGSNHWNGEYYGLAFPQAYAAVGNQDFSLQIGHFYSVVGYEGVMAPDNFFYSKSYSYQFAGPFTHWGGQLNWNLSDAWTVQAGIHNGWDAFDRVSDDPGFIGKIKYECQTTGSWTSFAIVSGKDFDNGAGVLPTSDFTNRTRYSWIVDLPLTCRWEYVFHHWLGLQQNGAASGNQADWYGIDQYLYYTMNDRWKGGMRFEWFRDEDGTRVGLNRSRNPNKPPFAGNFYSLSLGLNWMPTQNIVVRPEVRADWYDGNAVVMPYDDGGKDNQFMVGVDAILKF